jgi:cytochrome bd-type quinol oxidase subunit 2
MRWKLVVIVCLVGGLVAFGLWEIVMKLWIARLPRPAIIDHTLLWLTSFVPLVIAGVCGFFVYRHTSKRRKLQAALSFLLTIIVAAACYFLGSRLFPDQLSVIRECKHPPCV